MHTTSFIILVPDNILCTTIQFTRSNFNPWRAFSLSHTIMPPVTENTSPNLQQGLEQTQNMQQQAATAAAGATFANQNGAGMQANGQAQQIQHLNNFIWGKVDISLANMTPDRIADLVAKASDQVKRSPQWAASNDREKARLMLFHLYKQKVMLDNARRIYGGCQH